MKKNTYITIVLTAAVAVLAGCKEEPPFPDPGFDMVTKKEITVRRDTAEKITISLHVNAPRKVNVIQIRNGRNYELIEELTQYQGQTNFLFNYEIDFSHISNQKDTVLMYNVRVISADNRGYNSTFRIDLKKLSTPEILLPGNNIMGITGPVIKVLGLVSTGIYKIKSINIFINDEESYSVPASELAGLSDYRLEAIFAYNFEVGQSYPMRIEIRDERDIVHNELLTVMRVQPKRVTGIRVDNETSNRLQGRFNLGYDDRGLMVKIQYEDFVSLTNGLYHYTTLIYYNEDRLATLVEFIMAMQVGGVIFTYDFTYDSENRISGQKCLRYSYTEAGGKDVLQNEYETLSNFHFRPDGTVERFDMNVSTIDDIQYADGFYEGEKIFAEAWSFQTSFPSFSPTTRKKKSGFVPIPNPVWLEGVPPFWCPMWIGQVTSYYNAPGTLFFYKYIYTEDVRGPNNTQAETVFFHTFSYSTREDGLLESFSWRPSATTLYTYYYEYEGDE